MRLPAEVAGALSRLQGQMMAAQPELQNAYAWHWLAAREAGGAPAFQQMTQGMLWGLYGSTALSGLLRHALSGRATPDVMAGIADQVRLIQESYDHARGALQEFVAQPDVRQIPAVQPMVRSLGALDRVYQAVQQPMQTVTGGITWPAGGPMPMATLPAWMPAWGAQPGGAAAALALGPGTAAGPETAPTMGGAPEAGGMGPATAPEMGTDMGTTQP
jgi:hypothetical protein